MSLRNIYAVASLVLLGGMSGMTPATDLNRAVQKHVVVAASASEVWKSLTTTEGIQTWLTPASKIEPWVGGAYEIYFGVDQEPGKQGSEGCRVMSFEPESFLSFSWNAPPSFPTLRHQRTMVTIHLTPKGDKSTQVDLCHIGWGVGAEWDRLFAYFDDAWGQVLGALQERYDKGARKWPVNQKIRRQLQWVYVIRPARKTFPDDATEAESKKVGEHFAYLQRLLKEGRLVGAGRTTEKEPVGFCVFEAETEEKARAVMNGDPAVKAGLFIAELHPYFVALSR